MALVKWSDQGEEEAHRIERKRLSENHYNRAQTLAAWLLATLVAINGGAAIAIVTTETLAEDGMHLAFAFILGVLLAVFSGVSSWREAHARTGLYYLESVRPDQLTPEGKSKLAVLERRSDLLGRLSRWTNYLSLLAFVAGCAWGAFSYRETGSGAFEARITERNPSERLAASAFQKD